MQQVLEGVAADADGGGSGGGGVGRRARRTPLARRPLRLAGEKKKPPIKPLPLKMATNL